MDVYQRQQFDFLLNTAVERYAERLEQRNAGAARALDLLRTNPEADTIRLSQFVDALFEDFLLNNTDGACFVLRALPNRATSLPAEGVTVGVALSHMARSVFAGLLRSKTEERLEQDAAYQSSLPGE